MAITYDAIGDCYHADSMDDLRAQGWEVVDHHSYDEGIIKVYARKTDGYRTFFSIFLVRVK